MALLAALAVTTSAACGPDDPTQAQAPPAASTQASASSPPEASAGPHVAICDDSPAAADNAAAIKAAWDVLPQSLRAALSAKGLQADGAQNGMAPAAVVSGLVGIHVDALFKASALGTDGDKHVARITADVYVALVNRDPAFAAGTKPASLMKLVRERQTDATAGRGGFGVNVEFLPAGTVADLNALFGPVPDDLPQGPSRGPGRLYYRVTVDPMLTFFPVRANGTC